MKLHLALTTGLALVSVACGGYKSKNRTEGGEPKLSDSHDVAITTKDWKATVATTLAHEANEQNDQTAWARLSYQPISTDLLSLSEVQVKLGCPTTVCIEYSSIEDLWAAENEDHSKYAVGGKRFRDQYGEISSDPTVLDDKEIGGRLFKARSWTVKFKKLTAHVTSYYHQLTPTEFVIIRTEQLVKPDSLEEQLTTAINQTIDSLMIEPTEDHEENTSASSL